MNMQMAMAVSGISFALLAFSSPADAEQDMKRLPGYQQGALAYVSWDIFSGRQSPGWSITNAKDIEYLKTFFSDLQPVMIDSPPSMDRGLGKSCYTIQNISAAGFPEQVKVCEGLIRITQHSEKRYYSDTHGLEKFLSRQTPDQAVLDNGRTMTTQEFQNLQTSIKRE